MAPRIQQIRVAHAREWDQTLRTCPYATGFHSRWWAEVWREATNGRMQPAPRIVTFTDGTQALLPLSIEWPRGARPSRYVSSPAGTYGGWLSSDQLSSSHAQLMSEFMCDEFGDLIWRTNPFDHAQQLITMSESRSETTHVIPLDGGFKEVQKRWSGRNSTWRKIRRAEQAGVTVRQGQGEGDWRAYFQLYQQTLARWAENAPTPYRWPLFECLASCGDERVTLWLGEHNAIVVAGAICVHSQKHCAYWHGAAAAEALDVRPVNLLHVEIIRAMCDRCVNWYDFNPSGGHKGVERFKRSFGCDELTTSVVINRSLLTRMAAKLPGILRRAA